MDAENSKKKDKKQVKKIKKAMGRVILPPNKTEKDKKSYSRKTKHKKQPQEE